MLRGNAAAGGHGRADPVLLLLLLLLLQGWVTLVHAAHLRGGEARA